MKTISVVIPTYNEEENIVPFVKDLTALFSNELKNYDYEVVIIDNNSTDTTRLKIAELCKADKKVKTIFNIQNFGSIRSGFYALTQTSGDCVVKIAADFQEPIETIPKMVAEWEKGFPIVIGVKNSSKEGKLMFKLRTLYYTAIRKLSSVEQIEQFTGFGLYDKSFIDVCRELDDPYPYFRGIVAEFGGKRAEVKYDQKKREHGKSKYNLPALYDYGMLGITTYTKNLLRLSTIIGFIIGLASVILALVYLVLKIIYWDSFATGIAPLLICLFLLESANMFFIGLLGEYVLNINTRVINRPLVVEEKRINF